MKTSGGTIIAAGVCLAANALLAAIEPASPVRGETVTTIPAAQRELFALPDYGSRIELLKRKWLTEDAKSHEDQWGRSCPLVLRWRATDGERGPWKILVGKKADLSDARVWLVEQSRPRLQGEQDRDVFGVSITNANLEVGQTYHWKVWSNVKCTRKISCGSTMAGPCECGSACTARASEVATFVTDGQPPRWISIEGRVRNIRDIGGWRTRDGRRVKQGMAFRGQGLNDNSVDGETPGRNRLTVEDVDYLTKTLGIRTDLDLRSPSEVSGMTKSPLGDGVAFIHRPSPCYLRIFCRDGKGSDFKDNGMQTMAENFRVFCDERNYPIYFHCIGGADRTGALAYVLNAVLGVDRHDLEVDWESTFYPDRIPEVMPDYKGRRGWRSKEYFDIGFAKFGGAGSSWNDRVVQYLLACGVTQAEIEKFREIMLEPEDKGARTIRDVAYDASIGRFGLGDIYLPGNVTPETPVVLTIHGGGWAGGDRYSWSGVAEFFRRDLGCVAFNIEYRLASAARRWPACGDDCIKAANWLFSDGFRERAGFTPKNIYICGGSAGGHLTLWTALNLPPEKVAGAISISGVADTGPDRAAHPSRYRCMAGDGMPESNPLKLIRPGAPRLLLTHAVGDKVVPVESERSFAAAYQAAGNVAEVFEYPCDIRPGLTGHCIWIPGSKPHRMIPEAEARIAEFMGRKAQTPHGYVPEPQPVKSAVEITALYYPGTEHMPEWDMVAQTRPEAKPLLGWYDEGSPEVIDWQIKWAVEHGISSFCVDWYWNRGHRRLEHWVKGYYKARYRKYLKWYMMYANHNQPGAHSTEDQIAVTKYWIDNCFKTPEYYTIDGKPVVCYWAPGNLDRDFIAEAAAKGEMLKAGDGIRRAFAISEKMVKEAGLPGIHWQKIGERNEMFSTAITYGYRPRVANGSDAMTFDMVLEGMPKLWKTDPNQWLPIPTGWDDRPRSFQSGRVIRGRTPEKFARLCREARAFCDRNGIRHVIIHPVNEWQEGSYIEPNREYGFAMYDALRDAFCEKPAAGWPENLRPSDVGLGPYDYPPSIRSAVQRWEFDSTTEGWYRQPYGGGEVVNHDGCLAFVTTRIDNFNIRQCVKPFDASKYRTFRIRMKITPNEKDGAANGSGMRLKWGTKDQPIIGPGIVVEWKRCVAGCPVVMDGEFHELSLDLSANPDWKGMVDELWFEACQLKHARVAIDWMRFE